MMAQVGLFMSFQALALVQSQGISESSQGNFEYLQGQGKSGREGGVYTVFTFSVHPSICDTLVFH